MEILTSGVRHALHSSIYTKLMQLMECSIDEVLELDDDQFVDAAYQLLLGRPPDEEGRRYYLRRIRAGIDKPRLIYEIAKGKEGLGVGAEVPGLQDLLRQQQRARNWLLRKALAWGGLVEPDDWYARRLRSIRSQIARLGTADAAFRGQERANPPNVPGGVNPLETWGVHPSLRYDANSADVSWTGFSAPEQSRDRFLRWCLDQCVTVGFWWPEPVDAAEIQLDIRTDGLLPLRIRLGSDTLFDHQIDVANGSIRLKCSGLARGFNELTIDRGCSQRDASEPSFALGLYAIVFFTN